MSDIVFTYVVLQNMLRTHQGGVDRAPTQVNDVVAQQNGRRCMCQMRTTGISTKEAKHQQELLKDYFNHMGALAGQEDRI